MLFLLRLSEAQKQTLEDIQFAVDISRTDGYLDANAKYQRDLEQVKLVTRNSVLNLGVYLVNDMEDLEKALSDLPQSGVVNVVQSQVHQTLYNLKEKFVECSAIL